MNVREQYIQQHLRYCQHYALDAGAAMKCAAGMDLGKVRNVPAGATNRPFGPCIDGHTLKDPKAHCPHWLRNTMEQANERADSIEQSITVMNKAMPVIGAWKKREPIGKQEVIECPVCQGRLHLSQASFNGHVRAQCETKDCVGFIE